MSRVVGGAIGVGGDFAGRTAIVTGAGSGIGAALSRALGAMSTEIAEAISAQARK